MWKIVTVLALTGLAIVTGQFADSRAAAQFTDTVPPLAYAGIRG